MNFSKLHNLNAKSIKNTLKNYNIIPINCRQNNGSLKGSISLVVKIEDATKTATFCSEFGLVNTLGKNPIVRPSSNTYYDFGSLYMSDEMFKELNN